MVVGAVTMAFSTGRGPNVPRSSRVLTAYYLTGETGPGNVPGPAAPGAPRGSRARRTCTSAAGSFLIRDVAAAVVAGPAARGCSASLQGRRKSCASRTSCVGLPLVRQPSTTEGQSSGPLRLRVKGPHTWPAPTAGLTLQTAPGGRAELGSRPPVRSGCTPRAARMAGVAAAALPCHGAFADAGGEHSPWLSAAMGRGGTRVARRSLLLPPAAAAGRAESGMEARIRSGRGHGPPARTCAEAAAAAGRVETLAGHRRGGTELPDQCPNPPRRARERA